MPGEELQELNPLNHDGNCDDPPCQAAALVRGKVLLGLGCYCDDPPPIDCTSVRGRRHLQAGEDAQATVEFSVPVEVAMAAVEEEEDAGSRLQKREGCIRKATQRKIN